MRGNGFQPGQRGCSSGMRCSPGQHGRSPTPGTPRTASRCPHRGGAALPPPGPREQPLPPRPGRHRVRGRLPPRFRWVDRQQQSQQRRPILAVDKRRCRAASARLSVVDIGRQASHVRRQSGLSTCPRPTTLTRSLHSRLHGFMVEIPSVDVGRCRVGRTAHPILRGGPRTTPGWPGKTGCSGTFIP